MEPFIAAGPMRSRSGQSTLIAVWTALDPNQYQGHTGFSVSRNGGRTWTSPRAAFTSCGSVDTTFTAISDPWASIGLDGTIYLTSLNQGTLLLATSSTGGRTWKRTRVVDVPSGSLQVDKPSVTADPRRTRVAYVMWNRLNPGTGISEAPVWLATTTDGGRTWKKRVLIRATQKFSAYAAQLLADPRTGVLYCTFVDFHRNKRNPAHVTSIGVGFMRSTDGGATWSSPLHLGMIQRDFTTQYRYWNLFRTGFFPDIAIAARTGKLYLVWWVPTAKTGKVLLSSSADGGLHWSTPVQVNRPGDGPAFTPTIAVNGQGRLGVTYFTHVGRVKGQRYPAKYWFRSSPDGVHFTAPTPIAGPFDDAHDFQTGGSYFLGDYMGLAASGESFHPIFIMSTHSTGVESVLTTTISP